MTLYVTLSEKMMSDGEPIYDVILSEENDPWEAVRLPAVSCADAIVLQAELAELITKHCVFPATEH